jgi:hypothetical protein
MNRRKILGYLFLGTVLAASSSARASGHGPVFTLATPTNAKGGWALDLGLMGRTGVSDTGTMFRGMLSYGITQDLQVSFSAPVIFKSAPLAPGRMTSMMPGTPDFEGIAAWRFHRQGTDVGSRFESTVYGGVIVPGPQRPAGMLRNVRRSPGMWAAVSTGMASRSHYVWGGLGYGRFMESEGDRRPDLLFYSGAWGYRPTAWQKDYPHWDWRLFAELTGERSSRLRIRGVDHAGTGGHQIFLGPTTLGIYKNYAIEGGIQFPMYRDVGARHQKENFRFAINFSYFF